MNGMTIMPKRVRQLIQTYKIIILSMLFDDTLMQNKNKKINKNEEKYFPNNPFYFSPSPFASNIHKF